jgi:hypothetical protein
LFNFMKTQIWEYEQIHQYIKFDMIYAESGNKEKIMESKICLVR